MSAPYPLLDQSELERRLGDVDGYKQKFGVTDTEWDELLTDIIDEESDFVVGELEEESIRPADFDGKESLVGEYSVIRRVMVRLCRASLNGIDSDGLSSASVGDHSESYRPPSELRAEVADEIANIDSGGVGGNDFRSSII